LRKKRARRTNKPTYITIGETTYPHPKTNKSVAYKYADIPKSAIDKNGWVFDSNYLPIPYDILELKIKGYRKPIAGWWNGLKWEGLRLRKHHQITEWKRNLQHD